MKQFFTLLFLLPTLFLSAQELPRAVKKINPALFVNNQNNQRIYQQANIRTNLVIFTRGYDERDVESKQQVFHYLFLDTKEKNWILELQFDENDVKIYGAEGLNSQDFGIKIYQKKEDVWKDVTLDALPPDFLNKINTCLSALQQSSKGMYFYNLVPEELVVLELEEDKLNFKQNGTTVLSLIWKKDVFVWKK
jgi:hypothetical protein